ncbi:MAG: tRNA pseudouridine(55) synthase TruB [Limnochordaceae bacterium]|nr:tRNA pseudouridine(55) synthase TruB [Limnochordaceae bacterium]
MTSHDVVALVRKWAGVRRVGHAGTLDPGAAGVLVVLVGQATRLASYLQEAEKVYRAEMVLGVRTDTQDASGRTLAVADAFEIPWSDVDAALARMIGTIQQRPPMVSAVHHQGRRLYELARQGVEVERPVRTVEIYDLQVHSIWPEDAERATFGARVVFDVTCSAGTYVRTLCDDVGQSLGCGAHLGFLVRLRSGAFGLDQAVTLEELEAAGRHRRLAEYLLPLDAGLGHLPRVSLEGESLHRARHGTAVAWPPADPRPAGLRAGEHVRLYDEGDRFFGIARFTVRDGRPWLAPEMLVG